MDYGYVINQAFRLTWKYKFLWIFGFFMSGSGGGFNLNFNPSGFGGNFGTESRTARLTQMFMAWVFDNLGLVIAIGLFLVFLWLVFFILSVISQAAIVGAANEAEESKTSSFGQAFQIGLKYFWRVLGLLVLIFLLVLGVILLFIGIPVGLLIYAAVNRSWTAVPFIVLLLILLILAFIAFAVTVALIQLYALRYIVISGSRVGESIGQGWRLFKNNVGKTLLLWLITVGFGIAFGIGLVILIFLIVLPAVLFFVSLLSSGITLTRIFMAVFTGLLLFIFFGLLIGVAQVYFSCYWTLAWRQLTNEAAASQEAAVTS